MREEVYYREALALGMDKDDLIIRRRLQQKMEFVSDDVAAQSQPTDDELKAYSAGASRFISRRANDSHSARCISTRRSTARTLQRDTAQLLAQLKQKGGKADISTLGDTIMLDKPYDALPASESRSSSAKSLPRLCLDFRLANGKGRSNPPMVCIWSA